jgi:hypothetical protein
VRFHHKRVIIRLYARTNLFFDANILRSI